MLLRGRGCCSSPLAHSSRALALDFLRAHVFSATFSAGAPAPHTSGDLSTTAGHPWAGCAQPGAAAPTKLPELWRSWSGRWRGGGVSCLAWVMGAGRWIQAPSPSSTWGWGPAQAGALGAAGQGMSKLWEQLRAASSQMEIWLHFPEGHVAGREGWAAVCAL